MRREMMRTIRLLQDTLALADKHRFPDGSNYMREMAAAAIVRLANGLATAAAPAPPEEPTTDTEGE